MYSDINVIVLCACIIAFWGKSAFCQWAWALQIKRFWIIGHKQRIFDLLSSTQWMLNILHSTFVVITRTPQIRAGPDYRLGRGFGNIFSANMNLLHELRLQCQSQPSVFIPRYNRSWWSPVSSPQCAPPPPPGLCHPPRPAPDCVRRKQWPLCKYSNINIRICLRWKFIAPLD